MELALNPSRNKIALGAAALLSLLYIVFVGRIFVATLFDEHMDLSSLQRAVSVDPSNAEYRFHVGRYYLLVTRDPASAIAPFRAAVDLNRFSARYWFELASA